MILTFLRPEHMPFASVEMCRARLTASAPPAIGYRLHVRHASGAVQTLTFASEFLRGLALIPLVAQPVDVRVEDVEVTS